MREWVAVGVAVLITPLVPGTMLGLLLVLTTSTPPSELPHYLEFTYVISLPLVVVLGLPAFFVLRELQWLRWWTSLLAGFPVGLAVWSVIPSQSNNINLWAVVLFASIGSVSAFVFWFIWRKLAPTVTLAPLEKRFASYLEKACALRDIKPFLLTYIRLLLLFRDEVSQKVLGVILERQKQLLGEAFNDRDFEDLRSSSRRDLGNESGATREATLNRMLFCALLDTEETDFFYLTEPMFEFVRKMEVPLSQLKQILESEFGGFKV